MSRLAVHMATKTGAIAGLSLLGGFATAWGNWWLGLVCLAAIACLARSVYRLNMKTTRQFTFFADSIRFAESNVGFDTTLSCPGYDEYYAALSRSLAKFNTLNQKRESEMSFYDNLLNRIDFALVVVDEQEAIVWINKAALDMLGRPRPRKLSELKSLPGNLYDTLASMPNRSEKIVRLDSHGKPKPVVVHLSQVNVRNERYRIFGFKNIQPVVEEVEGSAWQQLIRVLTHEMMNSLAPIISLSGTFAGSAGSYKPELMAKAMQTIHRRSEGLVSFVDNYKKIMQVPSPNRRPTALKPLIEDVAALFASQQVKVGMLIASGDITLDIDRGQIEQVLINLLKNAREACSGKDDYEIKITVMEDIGGKKVVSISDNGCGITPDKLDRIFVPFYTTKPEGSGIGLSICRQIITLHGGTLTVSSHPGKGSVFSITLSA